MKRCGMCRKRKDPTDFYKASARKDGLATACKACVRGSGRRHYAKNTSYYKEKADRRRKVVRPELQEIVQAAKSVPCVDCQRTYPFYVMDFDHVRGEKVAEVSKLAAQASSKKVLLEEIAKCEVVCANCHRERTYGPKNLSV